MWPWAALGLLVLVGAGLLAAQIVRIATPKGTLVVEADDPDVQVVVRKDGAVIVDRTKQREIVLTVGDDYAIELAEAKDGLKLKTDRFDITKGGKTTVRVSVEKPKEAAKAPLPQAETDPGRRALEWVLSVGGRLYVVADGKEVALAAGDKLPGGPLVIQGVSLDGLKQIDDSAIENLRAVPVIQRQGYSHGLGLNDTAITDAGLKRLTTFPGLASIAAISLPRTQITDNGLAQLKAFPHLRWLGLAGTRVTDNGLIHLAFLTDLRELDLCTTQVTDAGLTHVTGSGAGSAPVTRLPHLTGPEQTRWSR